MRHLVSLALCKLVIAAVAELNGVNFSIIGLSCSCSLRLFLSTAAFRRAVKLLILVIIILLPFNRQCSLILNNIVLLIVIEFHLSWGFSISIISLLRPPSFLLFLVSAFHLVVLFRLLCDLLFLFSFDLLLSLGGFTLLLLLLLTRRLPLSILLRLLLILLCLSRLFRRLLLMTITTFSSSFIFFIVFFNTYVVQLLVKSLADLALLQLLFGEFCGVALSDHSLIVIIGVFGEAHSTTILFIISLLSLFIFHILLLCGRSIDSAALMSDFLCNYLDRLIKHFISFISSSSCRSVPLIHLFLLNLFTLSLVAILTNDVLTNDDLTTVLLLFSI